MLKRTKFKYALGLFFSLLLNFNGSAYPQQTDSPHHSPDSENAAELVVSSDGEGARLDLIQFEEVPLDDREALLELIRAKKDGGIAQVLVQVEAGRGQDTSLFIELAKAEGLEVSVHTESEAEAVERELLIQRLRSYWDQTYEPPSPSDRPMIKIITFGTTVAALAGWAFLFPEHPPLQAGAYVGGQVLFAYLMTAWFGTLNNFLGYRPRGEESARMSPLFEMTARTGITFGVLSTLRLLSGPIGEAHALISLPGFLEILTLSLVSGITSARYATWANRLPTPAERRNANILWFLTTYPLVLMDQSGIYLQRFLELSWPIEQTYFQATGSMALLVAVSFAMIHWVKRHPENFRRFIDGAADLIAGSPEARKRAIRRLKCRAKITKMKMLGQRVPRVSQRP